MQYLNTTSKMVRDQLQKKTMLRLSLLTWFWNVKLCAGKAISKFDLEEQTKIERGIGPYRVDDLWDR